MIVLKTLRPPSAVIEAPIESAKESAMFRYSIAVVALSAAALAASPASAGGGYHDGGYHHRGHHGGYHHHHRHGHPTVHRGWHGWHRFHRPIFASCWRWIPTPLGYAKVWICR
jgi:hypothetical protein